MKIAHVLRKYETEEWGGTESYLVRVFGALKDAGVESKFFCPTTQNSNENGSLGKAHEIARFKACVPAWGISKAQKELLVSVGGNVLSFDLPWKLWKEESVDIITTHALGRLGATALAVAKARRIPLIATVHGGYLDIPPEAKEALEEPLKGGWEWGKVFGALLGARTLIENADAVVAVSKREVELLRQRYPALRVEHVPPGLDYSIFRADHAQACFEKWPQLKGKEIILCVGRIDPVKNQLWLVQQAKEVVKKFPRSLFVFVGKQTDKKYYDLLTKEIENQDLGNHFLLTGGISHDSPLLIGLMQACSVLVCPSISEQFGIALAEAQMLGKPTLSSSTSGPSSFIEQGKTGFLFGLENSEEFHQYLSKLLEDKAFATKIGKQAQEKAMKEFDIEKAVDKMKRLYGTLIEERSCTTS